MALLRKLALDDGQDFRYWHASEWFSELQKQNRYGRDEASSWVGATAVRPIVVIDDLGQEAIGTVKGEDWAQAWFFRFLDIRLSHGLPLIVSTNLSATTIAGTAQRSEIRSDPLIRRLIDLCDVVRFV
jgi:DNA replication protein DnaC